MVQGPAFLHACAQAVSYPTQNGCHLSRAKVRTFAHNDVADLKRVLDAVAAEDRRVRCAAVCPWPNFVPRCLSAV